MINPLDCLALENQSLHELYKTMDCILVNLIITELVLCQSNTDVLEKYRIMNGSSYTFNASH